MSRGVVLRFEAETERHLRSVWAALTDAGVPSLAEHTHGLHFPHLSLVVAAGLRNEPAVHVVRQLARPSVVQLEAVGYFPQGVLHLAAVPARELLDLHRAAFAGLFGADAVEEPWPSTVPDAWSPHVTLAHGLTRLLPEAVSLAADVLPLTCAVSGFWIEDGDSGAAWPVQ